MQNNHQHQREKVVVDGTDASAGSKPGIVRWVLLIGTLLAILAMAAVFFGGVASVDEGEGTGYVSTQIAEERAKQDGQATTGDSFTSEARATPSPSATAN